MTTDVVQLPLFAAPRDFNPVPRRAPYVIALFDKPGEREALENLGGESAQVVPLVHLLGPAKQVVRPQPGRISSRIRELARIVGHHPIYLDFARLKPGQLLDGTSDTVIAWAYREAERFGLPFIPVHRVGSPVAVPRAVAVAAIRGQRGAALRIRPLNTLPPPGRSWVDQLDDELDRIELEARAVDLIIDIGFLDPKTAPTAAEIAELFGEMAVPRNWRNVILLAGSVPAAMSRVPRGSIDGLARLEWQLFDALMTLSPVHLVYGDYGVQHERPPHDAGGRMIPNIRYSTLSHILVARGVDAITTLDKRGRDAAYRELYLRLVQHPDFDAIAGISSSGDRVIRAVADGRLAPGSQKMWRSAGASRHIALTCFALRQRIALEPREDAAVARLVTIERARRRSAVRASHR